MKLLDQVGMPGSSHCTGRGGSRPDQDSDLENANQAQQDKESLAIVGADHVRVSERRGEHQHLNGNETTHLAGRWVDKNCQVLFRSYWPK